MIEMIERAKRSDFETIIELVVSLNSEPRTCCLHVGKTAEEVRAEFQELSRDFEEVFWVLRKGHEIVGVLGLDLDEEGQCVWLLGPFAKTEVDNEKLLLAGQRNLPPWVKKLRQYLDSRSLELIALHKRHWFRQSSLNYQYAVTAPIHSQAHDSEEPDYSTEPLKNRHVEEFRYLHENSFPKTWLSVDTMLERNGRDLAIFVTKDEKHLSGYVCATVHPTNVEGTIEYVAVEKNMRGRGFGKKLMERALFWLFQEREVRRVQLVVEAQKESAHRLYERCGFHLETVGLALELNREVAAALETEWHVHSAGAKKLYGKGMALAADCPWALLGQSHFVLAIDGSSIEERVLELAPCRHKFSLNVLIDEPLEGRGDICYMIHPLDEFEISGPEISLHPATSEEDFAKMKILRREIEEVYPGYVEGVEGPMVDFIAHKQSLLQGHWYLAIHKEEFVGAAGLIVVDTNLGLVGRLQDVDISPMMQGQGFGNGLLRALLLKAKDLELNGLFLRAECDDWPKSWYGRHGFKELAYCRRFSLTAAAPS